MLLCITFAWIFQTCPNISKKQSWAKIGQAWRKLIRSLLTGSPSCLKVKSREKFRNNSYSNIVLPEPMNVSLETFLSTVTASGVRSAGLHTARHWCPKSLNNIAGPSEQKGQGGNIGRYLNRISLSHSMVLEWWNTAKSFCNIWQHFSFLLSTWSQKYAKKIIVMMAL